jgi:hypothetical protein
MNLKALQTLNLLTIACAFLITELPRYIKLLAPYPRACTYAGVALGVISSLSNLVALLRSFAAPYRSPIDKSNPSAPIPPSVIALVLFFTAFLFVARPVNAQTSDQAISAPQIGFNLGDSGSCQLAAAVSAFQVNLKTGDTKRIAFLGGFSCIFNNWVIPYGATVYVGSGVSSEEGSSPQANFLIQLSNWFAFGPGVQTIKTASGNRVFQGLLSFVGTLNFGGTPFYVKASADRAVRAAVRAP